MEGGAVDALLFAGDDILRSVELRLGNVNSCRMIEGIIVPDESRIEGVQWQQLARYRSDRRWYLESANGARAPLRPPLPLRRC